MCRSLIKPEKSQVCLLSDELLKTEEGGESLRQLRDNRDDIA